ncbi:MAG: hypothetical protein PHG90_03150 [Clostridia bacterium]|nr:hypothetical protein [Clostridia bacterium]
MRIQIFGWNDKANEIRKKIVSDILGKLLIYFDCSYILRYDLKINYLGAIQCSYAHKLPCAHYDGSQICLTVADCHWCKFVYQLSHELCHCITFRRQLPQTIKWFDEFLCCFCSYFIENIIAYDNDNHYNYMFDNANDVFKEYIELNKDQDSVYYVQDTKQFYRQNREKYINDQNLIKMHDVYYINFFNSLNGDYTGLTFIGKIHTINTFDGITIEQSINELLRICNDNEKRAVNNIIEIFGIDVESR